MKVKRKREKKSAREREVKKKQGAILSRGNWMVAKSGSFVCSQVRIISENPELRCWSWRMLSFVCEAGVVKAKGGGRRINDKTSR